MPKGGLAIMLGIGKPKHGMKEEDDSEDTNDLEVIAKELIDAVKKEDATAVADALRAAVTCCKDEEYDDEEEG